MRPRINVLFLCILLFTGLNAEELHYKLGTGLVSMARVVISNDPQTGQMHVICKGTGLSHLVKKLDFDFNISYSPGYYPLSMRKKVDQGDYTEDRLYTWNHAQSQAGRYNYLDNTTKVYHAKSGIREFFTAMFYLRDVVADTTSFYLDADTYSFKGRLYQDGVEDMDTGCGTFKARRVHITFTPMFVGERERSDMLTNNLVKPGKELVLWYSQEPPYLPLRAEFASSPLATWWKLTDYIK